MVEDLARRLSNELIESEYAQRLIKAKKAYEADFEAQKMVQDYVDMQNCFQARLASEEVTDEEKDQFYLDINKLNNAIKEQGTAGELYKAESEFNEYMTSIFGIITNAVQNEIAPENGGCSGSCGTCGGCH